MSAADDMTVRLSARRLATGVTSRLFGARAPGQNRITLTRGQVLALCSGACELGLRIGLGLRDRADARDGTEG